MKTKQCDICGRIEPISYVFWSEITVPDLYDYEQADTYDVCNKCFIDYIRPAIIVARKRSRGRKQRNEETND